MASFPPWAAPTSSSAARGPSPASSPRDDPGAATSIFLGAYKFYYSIVNAGGMNEVVLTTAKTNTVTTVAVAPSSASPTRFTPLQRP